MQFPLPPLPMPPPQPQWVGLDTATLRKIAIANNINGCANQTGITQNRTIGVAFETWVLKTMGQLPRWTMSIESPRRKVKNNNGLPASVIPEFVDSQSTVTLTVNQGVPAVTWDYFPNSMFYEVKAVTGNLTLGTSQWQILGLLDVATRFPTVPAGPHAPPVVIFTTTSNTVIPTTGSPSSPGVVTTAIGLGVGVWQQKVYYDANGGTNPKLSLGDPTSSSPGPTCLTPSLYPSLSLYWIDPGTLWPQNPLTWPTVKEQDDVGAVPDPDSPAVD